MIKNYLKIAFRSLWKNKAFSSINIMGLAAGLAVCLLIVLYVKDELSYDQYHEKADRIYRLETDILFNGTQVHFANACEPLAPALLRDNPQVEQIARINNEGDISIKKGNENIQDRNAAFADSTFFQVFTVPLIAGDPLTALKEPNSIVIDESAAKRYFNNTDVIGKTLYVNNNVTCKITGVFKDMPRQSHFHFSFLRPLRDGFRGNADNWLSNNTHSYILLKPGITQAFMQKRVDAAVNNYLSKQMEGVIHSTLKEAESKGNHFRYPLRPLTDIHLHSNKSFEFEANGNLSYVYIFSVIAVFILLIACVNFMNLSTARSANRAKEVGIRKVAGSRRVQLITQFLTESVVLSFCALLLALLLAAMLLPLFNILAGKEIPGTALFASWLLPVMIALVLIVGLIAGSYPAFYLSSFQPIAVLKGKMAKGFKSSWLRSSLVVFQFSISIVLIIGTIVVYNQLEYMRNRQIGYNRNQVLVLRNTYPLYKQTNTFREQLLSIPGIENASVSNDLPTQNSYSQNGWFLDATLDANKGIITGTYYIDEHYIPTLGMQMAAGRNFSKEFLSDSTAVILNEEAVKLFGFKEPLKETLYGTNNDQPAPFRIVGVVKDFNFSTMHNKVGPLVMQMANSMGTIAVRLNTSNIPAVISNIESNWKRAVPGEPFLYSFMDADFNNMYKAEQQTGKLFMTFAIIAILIGCLGLFGLVTYAAEQRTKEIGVRKVLGASIGSIVTMLSRDFARLVLIASIIAFPLAWWAMNQWLQDFAYRVSIAWWVFALAGIAAILIALITVSFQAIKAALANPVKSLRSE
jgi:putative ABC transport system permease protein